MRVGFVLEVARAGELGGLEVAVVDPVHRRPAGADGPDQFGKGNRLVRPCHVPHQAAGELHLIGRATPLFSGGERQVPADRRTAAASTLAVAARLLNEPNP
ncbi:hypothetical protein GCM10022222_10120 [Amycolatopsis ultiminotia]|uniref:Uncharacterized protein n=1 Tax=Amycolatopsis ultiminotia TaxID=543629 RepID=A0ABP6V7W2_9PSEU